MAWKISFDKKAEKQFAKLSRELRLEITDYLFNRVAAEPDPRRLGKALAGKLKRYWRYRVGDYRVICELRDHELLVMVIEIGHRKDIYR